MYPIWAKKRSNLVNYEWALNKSGIGSKLIYPHKCVWLVLLSYRKKLGYPAIYSQFSKIMSIAQEKNVNYAKFIDTVIAACTYIC